MLVTYFKNIVFFAIGLAGFKVPLSKALSSTAMTFLGGQLMTFEL